MREDDSNWFSRWDEELPPPEDLMPLSQSLITPDLAIAFDIRNPHISNTTHQHHQPQPQQQHHQQQQQQQHQQQQQPSNPSSSLPNPQPTSAEFADSAELGSATAGEEPARTLKRPRLVWTPQLHKRFVDAVAHLGIKNAVPKTIMQLMSVDGLTRENVASHLQKYRLYLKRMQGISASGGGGPGAGAASVADPATDHLFASSPVPAHFLHPAARPNSDHFLPFVPVPALHHHHQQQQQMAAAAQYHRQVGHFGSPPTNGHFENPFMSRPSNNLQRIGGGGPVHNHNHNHAVSGYVEDMESANAASGGRKVLTLFPTGDD